MVYVVELVGEALNKTLNKESGERRTGWVHSLRVAVPTRRSPVVTTFYSFTVYYSLCLYCVCPVKS